MRNEHEQPARTPDPKTGSKQHYVPRLLLRPFAVKTKLGRRVWVYDKNTRDISAYPISKILCARGFYDLPGGGGLDGKITGLEDQAGKVLHQIRCNRSFNTIDDLGQKILALFVATQFYRTNLIRSGLERLAAGQLTTRNGELIPDGKEWFATDYPGKSPIEVHSEWLATSAFALARFLFTKIWAVSEGPHSAFFVISDHPVLLRHQTKTDDAAAIFAEGTLYLPLAPDLMLVFMEKSVIGSELKTSDLGGLFNQIWFGKAMIDANELALLNRLQFQMAERYVISNIPDFAAFRGPVSLQTSVSDGTGRPKAADSWCPASHPLTVIP